MGCNDGRSNSNTFFFNTNLKWYGKCYEADHNKFTAKFVRVPGLDEVPYPVQMEPNLVVEYYSR